MLFHTSLDCMSQNQRIDLITAWIIYRESFNLIILVPILPDIKPTKQQLRASIILGMVGTYLPDILSARDCKHVAEALQLALKEDPRGPYSAASTEILGRGFAVWAPHINGSSILKSLIRLTGITTVAPVVSKNDVTSRSASPSTRARTGSAISATGASSSPSSASEGGNNMLVTTARHAVIQIATSNSALFATTIVFDLQHNKSVGERTVLLKLLGMFISKVLSFKFINLRNLCYSSRTCHRLPRLL
jgi:hypothetical protein